MKEFPILFQSPGDSGEILNRIEVASNDLKSEDWLQQTIFNHPEVLPVSSFDEAYAPLIPIGREVSTNSGPIDNLYVSPSGKLTIVETKLWKNSEKHRTVVAQVIDYAKEVSGWNYDQLNEAVLKASRSKDSTESKSLDQIITPKLENTGLEISDFQELVIDTLHKGEFLLLIVGDKISANVALLSDAIKGTPGLDFRLGLIELQLYQLTPGADWPLVIIPDIVGRTIEVTRGVIKVQYTQEKPSVAVEIAEETPETKRGQISPAIFLQQAPNDLATIYEHYFDKWKELRLCVFWGSKGFSLRPSVGGKYQTILEAYPDWALSLVREQDVVRMGITEDQYNKYLEEIGAVPNSINVLSAGKKYIKHDAITADGLEVILDATTNLAFEIQK